MGRINHGPLLQDPKGILGDVTLGKVALKNWMIYPMNLDPVVGLKELSHNVHNDGNTQIPSFYTGNIPPTPDGIPKDTFLHLPHWFKVRKHFQTPHSKMKPHQKGNQWAIKNFCWINEELIVRQYKVKDHNSKVIVSLEIRDYRQNWKT